MHVLILPDGGARAPTERWFRPIVASRTPIAISDLVELRAAVDTLRVAAGLAPVAWEGKSAADPTFRAGQTPIRARHFTQLRQAIAELRQLAELGPFPEFTGGPIIPGRRVIRVSDPLDLRAWVEQYEAAVPERAARAVQLFGEYTSMYPDLRPSPLALRPDDTGPSRHRRRLTEEWDGAGFGRYGYDADGHLTWRLRFVDDRAYRISYAYDTAGRLQSVQYPAADAAAGPTASYHYADHSTDGATLRGVETSLGIGYLARAPSSGDRPGWVDDLLKLSDARHKPDGPLRVSRDLHGVPVKVVVDDVSRVWIDGTLPAAGTPAQRRATLKPVATIAWGVGRAALTDPVAYGLWSSFAPGGWLIGTFPPGDHEESKAAACRSVGDRQVRAANETSPRRH